MVVSGITGDACALCLREYAMAPPTRSRPCRGTSRRSGPSRHPGPAPGASRTAGRNAGFTLPELLIGVLVLAVGIGLALPSLHALADRQRADGTLHLLTAHLALARTLAIQQRREIHACVSLSGLSCRKGWQWHEGWALVPGPGSRGRPSDRRLLARQGALPHAGHVRVISNRDTALVFRPSGRSAGTNRSISICIHRRVHAVVVIQNSGRVRTERLREPKACPG